ncbi:transposase [Lactobacillus delbrueckii]|uniref:IS4 family transposase n=1 Tax=Lactobacillus delbrueckii TaxID=1584 RepID=UPI0002F68478|nr:transposase [Lactobacillus delbrueckii]
MSSLPSFDTENEPKIARSVEKFFKDYKVMELLRRCGLRKSKGIPLWSILSYIFSNVFPDRSMYMQQKSGKCTAGFSKNTYYRFMQNPHINWLRLTILLAERIVNGHLKDLTSDQRADCFVFDDSLYSKTGYKKTELTAKVFDHVSMTYKKGFRMMTMGWTDGSSFVPIASSLLSSKNDQNVIGTTKKIDKRTIKGDHVVIQLLDQALKAGLTAKYVMFDTWFSNPHQIVQISQRGLNVIAMVKKSSKITYEFEEKRMNVKQIFNACKKRRGRSRYLLSVPVKVGDPAKDGAQIDARIVCVRNRSNRKDWIALICTDMTIDENEIIRIYGKRWDIEVFFKTCKSFLKLGTEYHGLSYDALTAHTAFVFLRYMFMSVEKLDDEDDRTIGELFSTLSQVLSTILGNFILK